MKKDAFLIFLGGMNFEHLPEPGLSEGGWIDSEFNP
jgi:hypothetical protein